MNIRSTPGLAAGVKTRRAGARRALQEVDIWAALGQLDLN
jgi:hypothetical protein